MNTNKRDELPDAGAKKDSGLTKSDNKSFDDLIVEGAGKKDQQISELQKQLAYEKDARLEERFTFIALIILLFDVVFFSVMPTFGGPLAVLILELLILIPLARRMGMDEIARIISRVIDRLASREK